MEFFHPRFGPAAQVEHAMSSVRADGPIHTVKPPIDAKLKNFGNQTLA
jgi:hypothetical protein